MQIGFEKRLIKLQIKFHRMDIAINISIGSTTNMKNYIFTRDIKGLKGTCSHA